MTEDNTAHVEKQNQKKAEKSQKTENTTQSLLLQKGYNSENTHFWPNVGKAKIFFGGIHFFYFLS